MEKIDRLRLIRKAFTLSLRDTIELDKEIGHLIEEDTLLCRALKSTGEKMEILEFLQYWDARREEKAEG